MIAKLILVPLIAAVTGYVTNYIAVRMLFRPRREVRFGPFRFQGLIPRRRAEIAESIADTVEKHLVSHEDIRRTLDDPEVDRRMRQILDARVDEFLKERLPRLSPMVRMFLSNDLAARLKGMITDEIARALPSVLEEGLDFLEERLDFRKMVVEKVTAFDLDRLEEIILSIASRELRAIEILGGVLGFGIGLVTDLLLVTL